MTDAPLATAPKPKLSRGPRRTDGRFAKGWNKGIGGPGTTNWAQKRRAACEAAFDKAITTDEFYRVAVRLRNIALLETNDQAILPSILRAIEMVFQYRLGKPRQAIDIAVEANISVEQRILLAKVAAGLENANVAAGQMGGGNNGVRQLPQPDDTVEGHVVSPLPDAGRLPDSQPPEQQALHRQHEEPEASVPPAPQPTEPG